MSRTWMGPSPQFSPPSARACVQRLTPDPEQDGSDDPEGAVALGELVVACSERAELFEAADQILDQVPTAIDLAVKWTATGLMPLVGDGVANTSLATVGAVTSPGVGLVTHHAVRSHARTTTTRSSHRTLLQQVLEDRSEERRVGKEGRSRWSP